MEMQNIKAVTCGWFSAAFLIHLNHTKKEDLYKSANDFSQLFCKNTLLNNKVLGDSRRLTKWGIKIHYIIENFLIQKDSHFYKNCTKRNKLVGLHQLHQILPQFHKVFYRFLFHDELIINA